MAWHMAYVWRFTCISMCGFKNYSHIHIFFFLVAIISFLLLFHIISMSVTIRDERILVGKIARAFLILFYFSYFQQHGKTAWNGLVGLAWLGFDVMLTMGWDGMDGKA
ncbi:hypothetical protein OCU04_011676 [Sclerotinia nivalis]|uniref:Uncharacterized protein n=1 Tax=Sclerotinia nivalis TaxID=352851 RepID=A0A9X0AC02_9HELO|nr:hypothetical protein OCU04_011676 [Sclerotinia nivalis]